MTRQRPAPGMARGGALCCVSSAAATYGRDCGLVARNAARHARKPSQPLAANGPYRRALMSGLSVVVAACGAAAVGFRQPTLKPVMADCVAGMETVLPVTE